MASLTNFSQNIINIQNLFSCLKALQLESGEPTKSTAIARLISAQTSSTFKILLLPQRSDQPAKSTAIARLTSAQTAQLARRTPDLSQSRCTTGSRLAHAVKVMDLYLQDHGNNVALCPTFANNCSKTVKDHPKTGHAWPIQ